MSRTNITIRQLAAFAAVVDHGGFSPAGEALGLTQSAVSLSVRALEEALDARLLTRTRDRPVLTRIGREVLDDARIALNAVDRMAARSAAQRGVFAGTLRIGSVGSVAARLLPAVLRHFRAAYPDITVNLFEGMDGEICEWVRSGPVDIGFCAEVEDDLEVARLARDPYELCVRHDHPLAERARVGLGDLRDVPFIMSGADCGPVVRRVFEEAGITPNTVLSVRDMGALVGMVREGLGATIIPALVLPEDDPKLARVPLDPPIHREISLVSRAGEPRGPALQAFFETLADTFSLQRTGEKAAIAPRAVSRS